MISSVRVFSSLTPYLTGALYIMPYAWLPITPTPCCYFLSFFVLTMSKYPSRTRPSEEDRPLLSSQPYSGDSLSLNRSHLNDVELDDLAAPQYDTLGSDPLFGEPEAREKLEKGLLRKLDLRMSILVIIYILNCEYQRHLDIAVGLITLPDIDRNSAAYTVPSPDTMNAAHPSLVRPGYVVLRTTWA